MIKHLFFCPFLQCVTGIVLHAWFERIPRRGHLRPLSWDHASGPEARARLLLTLGALDRMLEFPNVVVRVCIGHRAGPTLVESVVTDRPALESAFIQIGVGQPRHASFRPARARSCREQRTVHGVVLTFLEKTQTLLDDGNIAPRISRDKT